MASTRRVEDLQITEAGVGDVVVEHDRGACRVEPPGERAEPGGLVDVARRPAPPARRSPAPRVRTGGARRAAAASRARGPAPRTRPDTRAPRRYRAMPSASALPSASASGRTCASRVTSSAAVSSAAAAAVVCRMSAGAAASSSALSTRAVTRRRAASRGARYGSGSPAGCAPTAQPGHLRVRLPGAGEQLLHPAGLVGHRVLHERQGGGEPDAGTRADQRPQHPGGAGQRGGGAGGVRVVVDRAPSTV